jgi:tocopherol cyclase
VTPNVPEGPLYGALRDVRARGRALRGARRSDPALDGWFWRFTWPDGRVAIVLCGACPGWAVVGVGAHPGRVWWSEIVDGPEHGDGGIRIGSAFAGEPERVRVEIEGARAQAELRGAARWPRPWPGTGPAGRLPGLSQVWIPQVLRAHAEGFVDAGERWSLDGATAYAERNWGSGFPSQWWWGEAHDFAGDPVTVAFAGGPALGPLRATAVVVRVNGRLARFGEPVLAPVTATVEPGRWTLHGRSLRHRVEIEAEADPTDAHVLDVPVPAERRTVPWSHQHLAGRLRVKLSRRGGLVYDGETELAGLEQGRAP